MDRRLAPLLAAAVLTFVAPRARAQNYPTWQTGFPFLINEANVRVSDHPAVADLGLTPGWKSIVFGTSTGHLYVVTYNGTNAAVASGFPKTLPAEIDSAPAIGDVDGDGIPDIVVGYGTNVSGSPGGVCAFHRDGTAIWPGTGCRALDGSPNGFPNAVVGAPAIGDVNGDGLNEVVFGSFTAYAYVVNGATGADEPGWPKFLCDTIWSSPALFDIDGDGRKDIIIGVDAHTGGAPCAYTAGGYLHVLRYDATEVAGFPFHTLDTLMSPPAVGDIDGDGKPEIVFGTGTYYYQSTGGTVVDHHVYALKCDGTAAAGWPVSVDGEVFTAPALADLTGDGVPEVIVTDGPQSPSTTYHVYAFNGATGAQLWKTIPKSFSGATTNAGDPIAGDVLGDGNLEVLVPVNTELVALSNTGVQLTCSNGFSCPGTVLSFYTDTSLTGGAAVSLKTNPASTDPINVVAVSATPFGSPTQIQVSVWAPKTSPSASAWPMFREGIARNGVVAGTASCGAAGPFQLYTLVPCRAVDTRNANGTYGGPALAAGATRAFPLAGQCGIPSNAASLSLNVTSVAPSAPGYLTLFAGGTATPSSSTLNMKVGAVQANNAVIGLSSDGTATLNVLNGSSAATDVVIDVNGYFR